ncbi:GNAT family N-acetyltransferase [Lysinibacillus cavernae]|uniref:GNAT family N-acetyltransferase n=1 Tax=Lysinibacillus cavernae TaxID=2666135 RepID=UPI0018C2D0FB
MNETYANEILHWQYEQPYDFYNNEVSDETLQEMLENPYYAIVNDQEELIGFYCTGSAAQVPKGHEFGAYVKGCVDVGIGMNPNLTGQGLGATFFSYILMTIQQEQHTPLRLTVAQFNKRAIHLYEKFGFVKDIEFSTPTTFITMLKIN